MKTLLFLLSLSILSTDPCSSASATSQRQILNDLLDNDYDINEWPHAAYGKKTDVHVQMFINSFGSLNAANMEYHLDTFLRQRWRDPRLAYTNHKESFTVQDEEMRKKLWKPDTFFENVKDASIHQVTMPNILFRISRSGDVLYSMRIKLRVSCNLQLHNYPLDSQNCILTLASYANTDDVIKYHWEKIKAIDLPAALEIAQFDLVDINTIEETYNYVTGNFSGLHARFTLRRQNGYHIIQTYIPTIIIVSISWVSFWIDPNAVPGRVTLGVTTLLTLTTLAAGIRQTLPPVSYVKAIDVWIGMCMVMVFGALLEFTLANFLANRKIPSGKTPFKIPQFLLSCSEGDSPYEEDADGRAAPKKPTTYINYALAVDRISRALFPGGFLIFNLFYWPYYLMQQYTSLY